MNKRILLVIPVIIFIGIIIIFKMVLFIGYVPSASMEPTLKEGSLIFGLRQYGELKAGDIIIFEHEGHLLVKRIAATGGQSITIDNRTYTVPAGSFLFLEITVTIHLIHGSGKTHM